MAFSGSIKARERPCTRGRKKKNCERSKMGKTKRKEDPEQGGRGYKEQIKTEAGLRD
jgi:hypothetical protein